MNKLETLEATLNDLNDLQTVLQIILDKVNNANAAVCRVLKEQEVFCWHILWVGMYKIACREKCVDWINKNLQCRAKKKMSVPELRIQFALENPEVYVPGGVFRQLLADRYEMSSDRQFAYCELKKKN